MTDLVERLRDEWVRLSGHSIDRGSVEAGLAANVADEAADEIERLRAEVEQQRLELGITEDACGMLESEVKQLRARVAELEAALDHYSGGTSEALLRAPAMKPDAP